MSQAARHDPPASRAFGDAVFAECSGTTIAHELIPSWKLEECTSVAALHSIAIAFTWPTCAVVRTGSGAARAVKVVPGQIGLGGGEPMSWLETDAPSDVLEVAAPALIRHEIARELGVEAHAGLTELHGFHDPLLLAIGLRLRGTLRGAQRATPLELDSLVRALYGRALVRCFGGRMPARTHRLSNRRVAAIVAKLESESLASVSELATIASMSPFHFLRSFKRTVGMTPHRLQMHLALDRGRSAWARGATVSAAATAAGYENVNWFRRQLKAYEGYANLRLSLPR